MKIALAVLLVQRIQKRKTRHQLTRLVAIAAATTGACKSALDLLFEWTTAAKLGGMIGDAMMIVVIAACSNNTPEAAVTGVGSERALFYLLKNGKNF